MNVNSSMQPTDIVCDYESKLKRAKVLSDGGKSHVPVRSPSAPFIETEKGERKEQVNLQLSGDSTSKKVGNMDNNHSECKSNTLEPLCRGDEMQSTKYARVIAGRTVSGVTTYVVYSSKAGRTAWMSEQATKKEFPSAYVKYCAQNGYIRPVDNGGIQIGVGEDSRKFCSFCDVYGGKMLHCSNDETHNAHRQCLKYSERLFDIARRKSWQCVECKTCVRCGKGDDPDPSNPIRLCDLCDLGYHKRCLKSDEDLKESSDGIEEAEDEDWTCPSCASEENP